MKPEDPCPCGGGPYGRCCGVFHDGAAAPATAEQLMRSRYAAFVIGRPRYLLDTLHPSKRTPGLLGELERAIRATQYLGLAVLARRGGGPKDARGRVEFRALYRAAPIAYRQEDARFVREDGRWYYVDGEPRRAAIGRNEPCWCGSGHKLKKCHATN